MTDEKIYDEITGLEIDIDKIVNQEPLPPLFVITNKEDASIGYACAPTYAEAMRTQMELGLRATTRIIEV